MTTLKLLSGGAARGFVEALGPVLAAAGVAVDGTFGAVGAMRETLVAGDACDVVVLTASLVDDLTMDGWLAAGSGAPLGRVETGIAVPEGHARPAIGDAAALAAALRAADAIYLPDPQRATAGIHFVDVLKRLRVYDEVAARLRPHPNGAEAMARMAADRAPRAIGCTQVTEIVHTDGVALVGTLPAGFGLATTYVAAVGARTADSERAQRFVEIATGPRSAALRAAAGFLVS